MVLNATDAGLKELTGLVSLQILSLQETQVNGTGLKDLAPLEIPGGIISSRYASDGRRPKGLGRELLYSLGLANTQVTDRGLQECLSKTQADDAGLMVLARLKSLQCLNLFDTQVTNDGVEELRKALPKTIIYAANQS